MSSERAIDSKGEKDNEKEHRDTERMVGEAQGRSHEAVEIACGDLIVASHQRYYHCGLDLVDAYHYPPALLGEPRSCD